MEETDFEGSLVLEKLAEIDKVDEFFEAIDRDDFRNAKSLMEMTDLSNQTISIVLKKMRQADDNL